MCLSLLHTRYTKNNKLEENAKFSNHHYHIQYIIDVQHKNVNMSWDYQKCVVKFAKD